MVLGIRSKSRKRVSIQVHYTIHVQEIKPWPPSQSLRSVQSVLLQWENGDQNSGSLASTAGIGKIEFNNSFRISVLMWRDASKKSKHRENFQKNNLEFSLYDKTVKSQLLGSATLNFADFGIIKEAIALSILLNCKKSSKNSSPPLLYISIQPFDTECSSSSPSSSLSKGLSLDKEGSESVSQSLKDDDDVEIASFTDDDSDDVPSNTFQTIRSASKTTGGSIKISEGGAEGSHGEFVVPSESTTSSLVGNTQSQTPTQFNGIESPALTMVLGSNKVTAAVGSPSLPKISEETVKHADAILKTRENIQQSSASCISSSMQPNFKRPFQSQVTQENSMIQADGTRDQRLNKDALEKDSSVSYSGVIGDKEKMEEERKGQKQFIERNEHNELNNFSSDACTKKGSLNSPTLLNKIPHERPRSILMNDKTEDVDKEKMKEGSKGQKQFPERNELLENKLNNFSDDDSTKKGNSNSTTLLNKKSHEHPRSILMNDKTKDVDKEKMQEEKKGQKQFAEKNKLLENELNNFSDDESTKKGNLDSTTLLLNKKPYEHQKGILMKDKTEVVDKEEMEEGRKGMKQFTEKNELLENEFNNFSNDESAKKGNLDSTVLLNNKLHKHPISILMRDRTEDVDTQKMEEGRKEIKQFIERNELLENELNNFTNDESIKKGNLDSTTLLLNKKPHEHPKSILMSDKIEDVDQEKIEEERKGENQFTENNELLENELSNFSNDDCTKKGNLNSTTLLQNKKPHERPRSILMRDKTEDVDKEKREGKKQFIEKHELLENELNNFSDDESTKKGNLDSTVLFLNKKPYEHSRSILMIDKIEDMDKDKMEEGRKGRSQFIKRNELNDLNNFSDDDSAKKRSLNNPILLIKKPSDHPRSILMNDKTEDMDKEKMEEGWKGQNQFTKRNEPNELNNFSDDDSTKRWSLNSPTLPLNKKPHEHPRSILMNDKTDDMEKEKMEEEREGQKQFTERNELLENEFSNFSADDSTKKVNLDDAILLLNKKPQEHPSSILMSDKTEDLDKEKMEEGRKGQNQFTERNELLENELSNFSHDDSTKKGNLNSTTLLLNKKPHERPRSILKKDKVEDVDKEKREEGRKGKKQFTERHELLENELNNFSEDSTKKGNLDSTALLLNKKPHEHPKSILMNDKTKDVANVKFPLQSAENYGQISNQTHNQPEEINTTNDVHVGSSCHEVINASGSFLNNDTELKAEVEMLQEELREAAALEVSMYSVIAEHGSSSNKVHAPARRLSRFYFHACRVGSPATIASAAQSAVSGFVLVSKACGNDVPRLTFWFSNLILLRAILSKEIKDIHHGVGSCINSKCDATGNTVHEEEKDKTENQFHSWEDSKTFLVALEKVEAWIFYRIVESVWWQTLTPYMQSAAAKSSSSRKAYERRPHVGDQDQGSFSIELWKRAFKDACERLCPLRTGGHECGCLAVIARLVMEQLVSRLDVAMFNAILRESAEEMPMDPVSDPISDSKVLPIPAGKSSFGAGAQLKNAVGDWSRWLSDLFSIDDSDSCEVSNENDEPKCESSFKPFLLLNVLSDLMMLPLDMLADGSTRKEVCPRFGISLIKRVVNNFVPDEFSPGPVPDAVFDALNNEDIEDDQGAITSLPCSAGSTFYAPPPASSILGMLQEVGTKTSLRSGSFGLKKLYTSDDELDELDAPLSALGMDESSFSSKEKFAPVKGGRKVVRYELLREAWKSSE